MPGTPLSTAGARRLGTPGGIGEPHAVARAAASATAEVRRPTSALTSVFHRSPGASPEDWVRLNVGGTLFETTRSTLTQDTESMLGIMFSSETWKRCVMRRRFGTEKRRTAGAPSSF